MSLFKQLASRYIVPGDTERGGLVFDAETDGLLDTVTKVHCIVVGDLNTEQITEYGPDQISAALEHLAQADRLIGHNIVCYDLPMLRKLYSWTPPENCVVADTLIASR